jgi:hypothetical protein
MVQLKILCGIRTGATWETRHFPVRIGRSPSAHLQLEEPGVWDLHLQLDFKRGTGFILSAQPGALASVNGQAVDQTLLRNGDMIEAGSLKLQFWLSETRQYGLRLRESLTWAAIGAISLGQIGLIYWLLS